MSVEQAVPGIESPIESIRKIQEDRVAKMAAVRPAERRLACQVFLEGGNINIESNVPPEVLLQVLGAAYIAVKEKVHPNTRVVTPERKIILP